MAWGAVAGAVISGVMAKGSAKNSSNAMDKANEANMAGFNLSKPYLEHGYKTGQAGLDYALDKGAYTGDTYSNMNNMSTDGYNYMNNFGVGGQADASRFLDEGKNFGSNYNSLYNSAGTNNLANANAYAVNNSQGLINSAMRDSTRQLNEQTLPGINMGATGTGNVNSSRAGVADAIARRSYDDRLADTTSNINNNLAKDYMTAEQNMFSNQLNANNNIANTYTQGWGMGGDISNMMTNAGGAFTADDQNQLNADKLAWETDANYQLDMNNKYMSGTMGKANTTPGTTNPNLYDPNMSGFMGGVEGYGVGKKIQDNWGGSGNNFSVSDIQSYKTDPYGAGTPTYGFG